MNDKWLQVVGRQTTVISDQSSQVSRLQHDLTRTRSTLSQLRAQLQSRHTDNDQLINTLRSQLQAVSRPSSSTINVSVRLY